MRKKQVSENERFLAGSGAASAAGYPEADDYYGKMDGKEEELPVPENPGIRHGAFYG